MASSSLQGARQPKRRVEGSQRPRSARPDYRRRSVNNLRTTPEKGLSEVWLESDLTALIHQIGQFEAVARSGACRTNAGRPRYRMV
jgi:hypothetical protein